MKINQCINTSIAQRNESFSTLATSLEELTHWKRPWCWEGLGTGGEEDDRGWDGWMVSPIWWTWVWVNSGSWWWTGRPGVLRCMGSQRVGHDWTTELNWTELILIFTSIHSSIYPPNHFPAHLPIHPPTCPFIYLPTLSPIHPSNYLSLPSSTTVWKQSLSIYF